MMDAVWCRLRGQVVDITVCHDSCVAPEQRPVCFMDQDAFFARDTLGDDQC